MMTMHVCGQYRKLEYLIGFSSGVSERLLFNANSAISEITS